MAGNNPVEYARAEEYCHLSTEDMLCSIVGVGVGIVDLPVGVNEIDGFGEHFVRVEPLGGARLTVPDDRVQVALKQVYDDWQARTHRLLVLKRNPLVMFLRTELLRLQRVMWMSMLEVQRVPPPEVVRRRQLAATHRYEALLRQVQYAEAPLPPTADTAMRDSSPPAQSAVSALSRSVDVGDGAATGGSGAAGVRATATTVPVEAAVPASVDGAAVTTADVSVNNTAAARTASEVQPRSQTDTGIDLSFLLDVAAVARAWEASPTGELLVLWMRRNLLAVIRAAAIPAQRLVFVEQMFVPGEINTYVDGMLAQLVWATEHFRQCVRAVDSLGCNDRERRRAVESCTGLVEVVDAVCDAGYLLRQIECEYDRIAASVVRRSQRYEFTRGPRELARLSGSHGVEEATYVGTPDSVARAYQSYYRLVDVFNMHPSGIPCAYRDCNSPQIHCHGVAASSTDAPVQSIANTLADGDPLSSFWSSAGCAGEQGKWTVDFLIYRTLAPVATVYGVSVFFYKCVYLVGFPVFTARRVKVCVGNTESDYHYESDTVDIDPSLGSARLYIPVDRRRAVGRFVKVVLIGKHLSQLEDNSYYVCVRKVTLHGEEHVTVRGGGGAAARLRLAVKCAREPGVGSAAYAAAIRPLPV